MHQRMQHIDGYAKVTKNQSFFYGRCSQINSSIDVRIVLGDVYKMVMTVLDKVQFCVYPP